MGGDLGDQRSLEFRLGEFIKYYHVLYIIRLLTSVSTKDLQYAKFSTARSVLGQSGKREMSATRIDSFPKQSRTRVASSIAITCPNI